MATPVIMPKFGMAQEDGTILRWLKQEGEHVEKGETLLDVQTDKVDMEVEAPATGVLRDVRYGVDATVPVTTVIAVIADAAEEARLAQAGPSPAAVGALSDAAASPAAVEAAPPAARGAASAASAQEARVSPVARRVAESQGVDLAAVQGTGIEGRVTRADVERAAAHPPTLRVAATPAARRIAREAGLDLPGIQGSGPGGRIQAADVAALLTPAGGLAPRPVVSAPAAAQSGRTVLRGKRKTIAARLGHSWQTAPHIFLTTSVDMTQAEALRESLAADVQRLGAKLTVTVILARAVATALSRSPKLNVWLREEGSDLVLEEPEAVNLGIAVALEDGLMAPVVHGAQALGLAELARRVGELSGRARSGQLTPDEVAGGTFTLSNLGMFPIDHFTAIINPPQVAILACGRAQMQPVWDGAQFRPRPVLQLTLSADHRAVDGAEAAAFLAEVKAFLESPLRLLL